MHAPVYLYLDHIVELEVTDLSKRAQVTANSTFVSGCGTVCTLSVPIGDGAFSGFRVRALKNGFRTVIPKNATAVRSDFSVSIHQVMHGE